MKRPAAAMVVAKKPAAESVAGVEIPGAARKQKQPAQDGGMSESEADALVADPAARRREYGKLLTAIKNNQMEQNGDNVVKLWDGLEKCPVDRDRKKRDFLKAWLMDPSFTEGLARCQVFISHITEAEETGRPVTRTQLNKLVGEEDATWLIDNNKLVPTKNRYDQDCFIYHEDKIRNLRQGGWRVSGQQDMKLDAEQQKSLMSNLMQSMPVDNFGGNEEKSSKKAGKNKGGNPEDKPKPLDPAALAAKGRKKNILKADTQLTQLKYKAVPLNAVMKKSKHQFAKGLMKTSDIHIAACADHRQKLEYLLHTENAPKKKFDDIMKSVGNLVKKLTGDIGMMEAVPEP